ncbi:hypothetical protein DY468_06320 [Rhodopseudomonas sp. BR0M22]|nr:hypothetical protein [Rhodopseudomonas sp. BR0M22]NEW91569.1 hypothetical protein [Rhodopseudomonas sp. BR0M22]
MPIYDRANNLLELLCSKGFGSKPIVFVGHSLGGLIIKKLLQNAESLGVERYRRVLEATRGVVFVATPHQGSSRVPTLQILRSLFKMTKLGVELEANNDTLRETYNWYRGKRFETRAFAETLPISHIGIVVDQATAEPGVPQTVAVPLHEDHISISKPRNRDELIYQSVKSFLTSLSSPKTTPANEHRPLISILHASNILDLISLFDSEFYFRWDPSTFNSRKAPCHIYWPVRLRHPTPIHAAQCFAAAGLQKKGATINLFIDDLGETNFEVSRFRERLLAWVSRVGGDAEAVNVVTFSQVIDGAYSGKAPEADPWTAVRKWLGETDFRLNVILKVSKLIKPNATSVDLALLNSQRPRRLLTPAMVWTCLSYLGAQIGNESIITLAGYDETVLWNVWKTQPIAPSLSVGHLFLPLLGEVDSQHGSEALHMEEPKSYSLDWDSRDDIRMALQSEFNTTGWSQPDRLVPWSMKCCIFLPQFVAGEDTCLRCPTTTLQLDTHLDSIGSDKLSAPLINELAKWLN